MNHSPAAIDAMEALFDFAEAMEKGVTALELAEVMKDAIAGGHSRLAIGLVMAQFALRIADPDQATEPA